MIHTSDEFYDEGSKFLGRGSIQDALDIARRGLKHFPEDMNLRLLEARALLNLGHYPLAKEILEQLNAKEPSEIAILLELTETYLCLGKKSAAVNCARELLSQNEWDDEDALLLAEYFDEHRIPSEVARCAVAAIKRNRTSAEAWFRLGCAIWPDHVGAAEYCCKQAVGIQPEFWIAMSMLGIICFDARRFQEARLWWSRIPINDHHDSGTLVRWRSLLSSADPFVKDIRRRWSEIRAEERPIPPHPWLS